MKILAVLRMVPDLASEITIGDDGVSLDREWLDFQLNDFDDHALEEAILLKEATGAHITVLCIGEGSNRTLQMAAAKGADEVVSLDAVADEMVSSRDVAHAVGAFAKAKSIDLVMSGVQSPEDIFGQLVPYLGGILAWPHVSGTSHVAANGDRLAVTQERGAGLAATWSVRLPAVLGVQTASKAPRYVSGSKLRDASRTPIGKAPAEVSEFREKAEIQSLALSASTGSAESLGENVEQVADKLLSILKAKGLMVKSA